MVGKWQMQLHLHTFSFSLLLSIFTCARRFSRESLRSRQRRSFNTVLVSSYSIYYPLELMYVISTFRFLKAQRQHLQLTTIRDSQYAVKGRRGLV
jgi:hypothetical protein